MKLLCVQCDEPMQVSSVEGPEEGSVSVSFGCATCGHRVALLTNPLETQLVRSLGVKIGGQSVGHEPLEVVRASLAPQSQGAFHAVEGEAVIWTTEAQARLERLPAMAQPMARTAIARYAREQGVATVTPELMDEFRARSGF